MSISCTDSNITESGIGLVLVEGWVRYVLLFDGGVGI